MKKLDNRTANAWISLFSIIVLVAALTLQYIKLLEPCPLCLMQRLVIFLILAVGVMGFAFNKLFYKTFLCLMFSGLFFSLRQLWLLSLNGTDVPACLPELSILVHYFPLKDIAHAIFWGTEACTKDHFAFWGISLPGWSTSYFVFIGALSTYFYCKKR